MNTYKSLQIAQSIATRLSKKGPQFKAIEIAVGQFAALTDEQYEAHLKAQAEASTEQEQHEVTGTEISETLLEDTQGEFKADDADETETQDQVPNFIAPQSQASKTIAAVATVDILGAYINKKDPRYIFVDNLGGKFRWFLIKDLKDHQAIDGGMRLTLPMKAIKSRGLSHLLTQASPVVQSEPTQEQPAQDVTLADKVDAGEASELEMQEIAEEQAAA